MSGISPMPGHKKTTTRRRSCHPARPKVSFLFDPHVPLQIRAVRRQAISLPDPSSPVPLVRDRVPASLHVLSIGHTPLERLAPEPPRARTFEAFAEELHASFSAIGDDLKATLESRVEARTEETFEAQIHEDDLTPQKPKRTRHLPSVRLSLPMRRIPSFLVQRSHPVFRGVATFVALALVFVFPLHALQGLHTAEASKGVVVEQGKAALDSLARAAFLGTDSLPTFGDHLARAHEAFAQAETALRDLGGGIRLFASVIPQTRRGLETGDLLSQAGSQLTTGGQIIGSGLEALQTLHDPALGTQVAILKRYAQSALPHLEEAASRLQKLPETFFENEEAAPYATSVREIPLFVEGLRTMIEFADMLETVLGNEEVRTAQSPARSGPLAPAPVLTGIW